MKTIIEMAREAGIIHPEMVVKTLEAFAELVRADESEACAKVCDSAGHHWSGVFAHALFELAEAIRARGNT